MKLITRQLLANEAPERFASQYRGNPSRAALVAQLRALPQPVDADAFDAIVGNASWTTTPHCHECNEYGKAAVVQVGEEPGYNSRNANLCIECATKVLALFGGQQ